MEKITNLFVEYPILESILQFLGIIVLAIITYLIVKKLLVTGIRKIAQRTETQVDDILFSESILKRVAYIAPLLVFSQFLYLLPGIQDTLKKFTEALIALLFLMIIASLINAGNELYERSKKYQRKPIKGYLQVAKIIIYILGSIAIIGLLTGQQPWTVLTGVGALSAILILIFKDTILSFVASIHISAYDLVRVGDWIEVPQYNADGDVLDVALHTIKVQNFDKTLVVFPTYKLLEGSFKNWRGMQLAGGRRIKRSIFIDLSSIKFLDDRLLNKFKNILLLKDYIERKEIEIEKYNREKGVDSNLIINGRRLTNIGTFREYLKAYLKNREDINDGFTFLVRQLTPGPSGIPIEIYVFAKTTNWVKYEEIQADIFDHIVAVIPEFELNIFQNPTGKDFRALGEKPE
jgi:miniconductance mechanosensitive channel